MTARRPSAWPSASSASIAGGSWTPQWQSGAGPVSTSIHVTLGEVLAALALVAVAVAVSAWQGIRLESDIAVAVVRSFIQLTAIG
jgi:hypothetical protein